MEGTLVNLIIQIIAGAIGGTAAGNALRTSVWARPATPSAARSAAMRRIVLWQCSAERPLRCAAAAGGLDIGGIVKDLVGGGVGGAVVMAIIGAIRNAMAK